MGQKPEKVKLGWDPSSRRYKKRVRSLFNGYRKKMKSWNTTGRSSKEKALILQDMRDAIKYAQIKWARWNPEQNRIRGVVLANKEKKLRRIEGELKASKEDNQELKKQITKLKNRVAILEKRPYTATLNHREKVIKELKGQLTSNSYEIRGLKRQLNTLKDKYKKLRAAKPLVKVKTKIKREVVVEELSKEERAYKRYDTSRLDKRALNAAAAGFLTLQFAKQNEILLEDLTLLTEIFLRPEGAYASDLPRHPKMAIPRLVDRGYLSINKVGSRNHLFITSSGKDFIWKFKKEVAIGDPVKAREEL